MSKYLTGICLCGKSKDAHWKDGLKRLYCFEMNRSRGQFKDSGLAAIESGSVGLYEAAEAVLKVTQYESESSSYGKQLKKLRAAVEACKPKQK